MKFWSNSEIPANGQYVPEKRLLAAVLQRAITDYVSGEKDIKESARSWLFDCEPTDAPLTFDFICEALDLDMNSLKKAIELQAVREAKTVLDNRLLTESRAAEQHRVVAHHANTTHHVAAQSLQ